MFKNYTVVLPPEVEARIMHWVHKADKEVSGLGDAWIDHDKQTIKITSAHILKQECTASDTELDDSAVAKFMHQVHLDEKRSRRPRQIKFWWHSHVNMGVFWSGTDQDTMKKLSEHGWFVHIVFNKKHEKRAAVSYPMDVSAAGSKRRLFHYDDELKVSGCSVLSEAEIKTLDKEFDDNYKEKTYVYTHTGGRTGTEIEKPAPPASDIVFEHNDIIVYYALPTWNQDLGQKLYIWTKSDPVQRLFTYFPERIEKHHLKKMDVDALEIMYWELATDSKHPTRFTEANMERFVQAIKKKGGVLKMQPIKELPTPAAEAETPTPKQLNGTVNPGHQVPTSSGDPDYDDMYGDEGYQPAYPLSGAQ